MSSSSSSLVEVILDDHAEVYARATKQFIVGEITKNEREGIWHKQDLKSKAAIQALIERKEKEDIKFLTEMHGYSQKLLEGTDIVALEMLNKMIEDWLAELKPTGSNGNE